MTKTGKSHSVQMLNANPLKVIGKQLPTPPLYHQTWVVSVPILISFLSKTTKMKPLWPPRSTSTTKTSTLDSPHKKLMKLLPRPTHNSLLQTRTTCTGYVLTPSAKHLELAAQSKRKTEPTLTNLFTTGTKNLRVYTDNQSRQDTEVNTTPQTQPASAILWNLETHFP